MTIAEWIDRRARPVPAEFRPSLRAEGPVSMQALLSAAEDEVARLAALSPRDRSAAFHLLAADAYVTYALALSLTECGDTAVMREAVRRVARGWWKRLR